MESPAVISIERIGAEIGDQDVQVAVVVDISSAAAHSVARIREAGRVGDFTESPVALVDEQAIHQWSGDLKAWERRALQQVDVGPAVVVVVEEHAAGAHGLRHVVAAAGPHIVHKANPSFFGYVRKWQ